MTSAVTPEVLASLSTEQKRELLELLEEKSRRLSMRKMYSLFPNKGEYRRELYKKHMEVFTAGREFRERCFMAANRVGKSELGAFETALHLTGEYPDWWTGIRFSYPTRCWACGDTNTTVRDIIQAKMYGKLGSPGTGMIPGEKIIGTSNKQGVTGALDTMRVHHITGGESILQFKSYEGGRKTFQGTEQDFIWEDEEPPLDVHEECLIRTMTTDGLILMTFTPLSGLSETVLRFMPEGKVNAGGGDGKILISATWDDVPHLSQEQKDGLWRASSPHQRDARSKGVPSLGSGAIYPIPESDFVIKPFQIPAHWPRAYGLDVGWKRTAAVWGALDRETGTLYIYDEHYRGEAEPAVHAEAIKARGSWIPGTIDPASRGRQQKDGEQLMQVYSGSADQGGLGLNLVKADNAVEAGIFSVWTGLSSSRIKIFSSCQNTLAEIRIYRRDEKGVIVKANDHAMDAMRYLKMMILQIARTKPVKHASRAHRAADSATGY